MKSSSTRTTASRFVLAFGHRTPGDTLKATVANATADSNRIQVWVAGTCCRGLPAMAPVALGAPKDGPKTVTAPQKPDYYDVVLLGTPTEPDGSPTIITQSLEFHVTPCPTGEQGCVPAGTDTRWFYDTDAIGSVRLITDDSGGTFARYDYAPFGEPTLAENPDNQQRFAGKELDAETGLNYFGARYFAAELGRFTAVDPIQADLSRVVDPQRWNNYSYAINNPFRFGDPDGRDVLVVSFPFGAKGAGHIGIAALNPHTGEVTYGGFNPMMPGSVRDAGRIAPALSVLTMASNGRPTLASLKKFQQELLRNHEGNPVFIRQIRTSDAATETLVRFINQVSVSPPEYCLIGGNCKDFVHAGLAAAGVLVPASESLIDQAPNVFFLKYILPISYNDLLPQPTVTTTETLCVSGTTTCWGP